MLRLIFKMRSIFKTSMVIADVSVKLNLKLNKNSTMLIHKIFYIFEEKKFPKMKCMYII